MSRSRFGLVGMVLLVLAITPASAATLQSLSNDDLVDRATAIVIGRATARQAVWLGRDLATLVTVAVTEALKGEAGPALTVALPGGIDRRRRIPIEVLYVGAPWIGPGEEVLLFLGQRGRLAPDTYVVSGLAQGKLSIVEDAAGVKWVSHESTAPARRQRLADVRDAIRLRLQGGASRLAP